MDAWYSQIEPEVRDAVKSLRNVGINTTCSCGHEMYIECESYNATAELKAIYAALWELGYHRFRVAVRWDVLGSGRPFRVLTVWLPKSDGSFASETAQTSKQGCALDPTGGSESLATISQKASNH